MMNGSNYVEYTPVQAYGIMPMANGIISGGTGDEVTVTDGVTFYWVYDPDNAGVSGFSGSGNWFCEVPNTPLANTTYDALMQKFASGIDNLNSEFAAWQEVIQNQTGDTDYLHDFMKMVGFDCFSTN